MVGSGRVARRWGRETTEPRNRRKPSRRLALKRERRRVSAPAFVDNPQVGGFRTDTLTSGGRTRTCDLRVMSPTSCQLLYPAIEVGTLTDRPTPVNLSNIDIPSPQTRVDPAIQVAPPSDYSKPRRTDGDLPQDAKKPAYQQNHHRPRPRPRLSLSVPIPHACSHPFRLVHCRGGIGPHLRGALSGSNRHANHDHRWGRARTRAGTPSG